MKFLRAVFSIGLTSAVLSLSVQGAPAEKPAATPTENNAAADAAWKQVTDAMRPPSPPAEWAGKQPTAEQYAEFNKTLAAAAKRAAQKAHDFYTAYPTSPKADDARDKEKRMMQQASIFEEKSQPPGEQDKLREKLNEVNARALAKKSEGYPAMLAEFEKGVRGLLKDYPKEPLLWKQLADVAQSSDMETAKRISEELVSSENAPEPLKEMAKGMLKRFKAVGQPFELAYKALDGREVDVQKMKGKVVLIDFWATWCGPCVQELPNVKKTYSKYHDKGCEIVGISLDKSQTALENFVQTNDMPWPQYFDGLGWGNKISTQYNVTAIPAMFLVDKKGNLSDIDAREDLDAKVQKLLGEK